jgi:small subunit ribosomal protein S2
MAESKTKESKKEKIDINLEEMAQAGLHFGHRTSKIHPKMKPYLYGVRNTVHIIDLEKTAEKLKEALEFVKELVSEGKTLLLIGTKIQAKPIVKSIGEECGIPYISERWLGGTFTNFDSIKKRIEYFKDLEKRKKEGALDKYTKKEKAKIDQELKALGSKFGGIKNLDKIPEAIFVLDMRKDLLAVKEAKLKKVKIIGVSDTNIDPSLADYPIPASDDAVASISYILEQLKKAVLSARK